MSVDVVSVLFVAAALVATGAFIAAWKREVTGALAGLPILLGGAGVAFVGVTRFATAEGSAPLGQEVAVLLSVVALAAVTLGVALAGRETPR